MKRYARVVGIVALLLIAGCATMDIGTPTGKKTFAQMSYVERATYFQEIYNKQYDDAADMATMQNLTPAQVQIYNRKKELLTKIRPMIRVYRAIVVNGGIPEPGNEQEINRIINELLITAF